jgi:hypothetical protein
MWKEDEETEKDDETPWVDRVPVSALIRIL